MQYVLSPEQMRSADAFTIETIGISAQLLMENAAHGSAYELIRHLGDRFTEESSVLILCGPGNNGGDGFAVARHLAERCRVRVAWFGQRERLTAETRNNLNVLAHYNVEVRHLESESAARNYPLQADCIVDAMLGIGGDEFPRGIIAVLLKRLKEVQAICVAIDTPTGLNCTNGAAHADCFRAELCLTMAAAKTGMYLREGPEYCGEIVIIPIGISHKHIREQAVIRIMEYCDIREWLAPRNRRTSKFDYGKVALIGGSEAMPGAITLSANACIRAGAGIVHVYTPTIHPALYPEVMPHGLSNSTEGIIGAESLPALIDAVEQNDVAVIGPGLGKHPETLATIRELLNYMPKDKTVVLDADGLLAVKDLNCDMRRFILTPHIGEFARITDMSREEVYPEAAVLARKFAAEKGCTLLLKNTPTIISNGGLSYLNTGGNPGMATPGSGDVLSGIIGALAGQGLDSMAAAVLGAYLHSAAGDFYTRHFAQEALRATDLVESLAHIFPRGRNR